MSELPTHTITINSFEGGVLMGLIEKAEDRIKPMLTGVNQQLIAIKQDIEKAEGVVKTILPNGMLEVKDAAGNKIIRAPLSWEITGN